MLLVRLIPSSKNLLEKCCIAVLSLTLLASESWETLLVFLWVVVVGFMGLRTISPTANSRRRHLQIALVVAIQIAPLFYYKYSNFFLSEVLGLDWERHGLLIPMGLSFYTFQMIGMTVDTAVMRKPLPKSLDFMNFASFFPQIVAGPIERRSSLLPQVRNLEYRARPDRLSGAASWVVMGFFYKLVLADNLALASDRMMINSENAFHVWCECLCFGFRIYFDFAGYSFIALGLAQVFGIDLTLNFRSPYLVYNIQEFWRRWHITLSQWFRDYVYIPMGGGRSRYWVFNVLVVFLVSGIWHGAGWNFVVWGLLHGCGIVIINTFKTAWIPRPLAWGFTMIFVFFTWLFFYENRMDVLWQKAASILSISGYAGHNLSELTQLYISKGEYINTLFLLILSTMCLALEWLSYRRGEAYCVLRNYTISIVMVILIVLLSPSEKSGFIYFNF